MKKFTTLAFAAMMAMSTACFAAGDGSVLNKLQKPAETMIDIFNNNGVTYDTVVKGFAAEAKKNFTEEVFNNVKKAAADKFGKLKESKFVAFQRMDQADIVAYLGAFTKEKVVNLVFFFDKEGKIVNFQFSPMQAQPAEKDTKAKK
ncbi:MAG: DUF3887 domain-containing protein [Acidaminococcaceae bacterium]|nr:DUF3887 domain-containing protein [Acidaminococcaceae bacterium]